MSAYHSISTLGRSHALQSCVSSRQPSPASLYKPPVHHIASPLPTCQVTIQVGLSFCAIADSRFKDINFKNQDDKNRHRSPISCRTQRPSFHILQLHFIHTVEHWQVNNLCSTDVEEKVPPPIKLCSNAPDFSLYDFGMVTAAVSGVHTLCFTAVFRSKVVPSVSPGLRL